MLFRTRSRSRFNSARSSSESSLMETRLRNVAQPASAVRAFFESIHSSANAHPCGFRSTATHGTVKLASGSWVAFAIQCCRSFFVIWASSAIKPGQVHRVVDAGVVKVERELVILLMRFWIFLQIPRFLRQRTAPSRRGWTSPSCSCRCPVALALPESLCGHEKNSS